MAVEPDTSDAEERVSESAEAEVKSGEPDDLDVTDDADEVDEVDEVDEDGRDAGAAP
jgi:hypothetical protein